MKVVRVAGLLTVMALLVAPLTMATAPVEITFWNIFVGAHAGVLNSIIARFHEAHPDIRVTSVHQGGYDDLNIKLAAATAAGAPPTMALLISNWVPPAYEDALYDLTGIFPQEIVDDIYPVLVGDGTFRGRLLTVPFNRTTNVLFYNTDLVPVAPRTWEELLSLATELRLDRDGDGRVDRFGKGIRLGPEQFAFLFLQAGGQWFNEDETAFTVDSPAGIAAMEYLLALKEVALFQTGFFSGPFGRGEVAMYWGSSAGIAFTAAAAAPVGTRWSIARLPAGPAQEASLFMGATIGIFELGSTPAQRAAALTFLEFLLSPEEHLYWVTRTGNLPFRFTTVQSLEWAQFVEANPFWKGVTEQLATSEVYPHHVEWDSLRRLLEEATNAVLHGVLSPRDALAEAAAAAQEYLR